MPCDDLFGNEGDILDPLTQRGQADWKHMQPIEQVLSELAVRNEPGQILIRRSDDADVYFNVLLSAYTLELSVLAETRSNLICIAVEISPISSKKSVPPSACSNLPFFCAIAPVKAPRSCPNNSDSRRNFRQRAAVDCEESTAARVGSADE